MKIVILTGAGISAESGIQTFRDSNGLWNNYSIEEVATYDAWVKNPELVMNFYNQRRKQLLEVEPNKAHYALKKLEEKYDVTIITQNVDDLHERAESSDILHLHGELRKARSSCDENLVYDIDGWELKLGDTCEKGSQLRPHVVWFGEAVPAMEEAVEIASNADIMIVIGTSLVVYPAASLIDYVKKNVQVYLVDPKASSISTGAKNVIIIEEKASIGVPDLVEKLVTIQ